MATQGWTPKQSRVRYERPQVVELRGSRQGHDHAAKQALGIPPWQEEIAETCGAVVAEAVRCGKPEDARSAINDAFLAIEQRREPRLDTPVAAVFSERVANMLVAAGWMTLRAVAAMTREQVQAISGIGDIEFKAIVRIVRDAVEREKAEREAAKGDGKATVNAPKAVLPMTDAEWIAMGFSSDGWWWNRHFSIGQKLIRLRVRPDGSRMIQTVVDHEAEPGMLTKAGVESLIARLAVGKTV